MEKIFCTTLFVQSDAGLEHAIRKALHEEGITPFHVPENAEITNDNVPENVRRAVNKSLFVLILLSPDFEKSESMRAVIKYAFSTRKMLLPYKIHPNKLGFGLQIMLGQSHWLDVSTKENPESGIKELRRVVKIHRENFLEEKKLNRRRRLRRAVGASVILIALFGTLAGTLPFLKNSLRSDAFPKTEVAPEQETVATEMSFSLPDGSIMEFVRIPPGQANGAATYNAFFLGKTEVTQSQYFAVMTETPSYSREGNAPVEQISWTDAMAFCAELTQICRDAETLPSHLMFSLPTSTQWLRAENGETPKTDATAEQVAWFRKNSGGKSRPVAQKNSNSFGLYDMHGNVGEWCRDEDVSDETKRYFCGKDFSDPFTDFVFPKNRESVAPDYKKNNLGFRVAVVPAKPDWEHRLQAHSQNPDKLSLPRLQKKERLKNVPAEVRNLQSEALLKAWDNRNLEAMKAALLAGASPDARFPSGASVLERAAWSGAPEFVKLLLDYGADPNLRGYEGFDPMSALFVRGKTPAQKNKTAEKIAALLCDYGFRADAHNHWNGTVLQDAVNWNCPEVARVLVRYGAEPQRKGINGISALDAARKKDNAAEWLEILKHPDIPAQP